MIDTRSPFYRSVPFFPFLHGYLRELLIQLGFESYDFILMTDVMADNWRSNGLAFFSFVDNGTQDPVGTNARIQSMICVAPLCTQLSSFSLLLE